MSFFRDLSIRRKLTMIIFCTSLLGLSIAGLALEIYERSSFRVALVDELTSHADEITVEAALKT